MTNPSRRDQHPRVAYLTNVVPNYRRPFLERLARVTSIEPTWFHGAGREGWSVKSIGAELPVNSVWTRNLHWPFGEYRIMWQRCFWRVLTGRYDVIVCEEAVHNLTTWALWLTTRVTRQRFVLHGFGYRPDLATSWRSRVRDRMRRLLLDSADAILFYTEKGRAACVAAGLDPRKMFVSGNTLDTEYLMSLETSVRREELDSIRKSLAYPEAPVVTFVGRLVPEKRIEVLFDACHRLAQAGNKINVVVIGDGPEKPLVVRALESVPGLRAFDGIYDDAKLAAYLMLSDLLVIPGRVGLTCVHGHAYGVPVMTSAAGVEQSPEFDYIRHGENGWLVERPDAAAYSAAISNLVSDRAQLTRMRAGARDSARGLLMGAMVDGFVAAVTYANGRSGTGAAAARALASTK
jgi:glycosyltransferase involved in cell wall biosynthesis